MARQAAKIHSSFKDPAAGRQSHFRSVRPSIVEKASFLWARENLPNEHWQRWLVVTFGGFDHQVSCDVLGHRWTSQVDTTSAIYGLHANLSTLRSAVASPHLVFSDARPRKGVKFV